MKGEISVCTAIMLNDHGNPYIESTTVLSDKVPGGTIELPVRGDTSQLIYPCMFKYYSNQYLHGKYY